MVEKDFRDLTVGEIHESMVGKPATVKEDAILKDAVDAITQDSTSHKVYVVDEEGKLKGAITIETLLKHVGYIVGVRETGMISFFKFLSGVLKENVSEIMEQPVTITNRHKVLDAVRLMVENHLNDLPIIDDENTLVGELNSLEIMVYAKSVFDK
ncbi:MAG: CBS domain-containing protein [Thermoplasmata archaeon]|nr:MAG: CBS domain-containing protein [Thermoplasmata archaeon]